MSITTQGVEIDVPVLLIKDLVNDAILGTDTLSRITAVINFNNNTFMCNVNNKQYSIKLGHIDIKNESVANELKINKPHINITSNVNNNNNNSDQLTAVQQSRLDALLNKHKPVFENHHTTTDVYVHEIRVTDESKFVRKTYPIPLHYQKQVDEEISKMLENNIIERSNSNFLNPMVVVKKKNNDIRICLDMRNLNSITQKCYDCAPNAENLFIKCQGVKYMTRLDLKSGFWQIPLAEDSRKFTALLYKNKCYQFKVVPFRLVTSLPAMVRCLRVGAGT